MCKNHPSGIDFKIMKGAWRAAETWHCEKSGKAVSESATSVAVDGPGLKRSLTKKLRLGIMKTAYERLAEA